MTKKERQKIITAIDYFLDSDPDRWVDGIDELYLLVHGIRWSEHLGLNNLKSVTIAELVANL